MENKKLIEAPLVSVGIEELNTDPGPFCMSFGFDLKSLAQTIERAGLINTPVVIREGEGRFKTVLGFRRILALKSLGWKRVACRDISGSGLSTLDLLLLNLNDNMTTREFNEVEKGMILSRLSSHLSRKEMLERFMPLLGIPSRASALDLYLKMEGEEEEIKTALARGRLSIKTFRDIMDMDNDSRSSVFRWMLNLKLNINQQKQFIEIILELAAINKMAVPELLEKSLKKILDDQRMNGPQKTRLALKKLRTMRFPMLSHYEDAFQKELSGLKLPKGIMMRHPPYFEGPGYSLEISFKDGKELKEKIDSLGRLKRIEEFFKDKGSV